MNKHTKNAIGPDRPRKSAAPRCGGEQPTTGPEKTCAGAPGPPRSYHRLAHLYLESGDLLSSIVSAGWVPIRQPAKERERAERIRKSTRFQWALRAALRALEVATCYRVATSDKGSAALAAARRLGELLKNEVERVAGPPLSKRW